jgi:putative phosphoesterase
MLIGLISDTHTPARWDDVPEAVLQCFAGVDFIIHAGDIGELWVLDKLSQIAPVIAVHGNDEGEQAKQVLPFRQTLIMAGRRIAISHGHIPDHAAEMESRKDDSWYPKLQRWVDFAKESQAEIFIYGHSHIPMALQYDGMWLINPGAIASGSVVTRQKVQTVARLYLCVGADPVVEHISLDDPKQVHVPPVNLDAGFIAWGAHYSESALAPELDACIDWIRGEVYPLAPQAVLDVFAPLMRRRWTGELPPLTMAELIDAIPQSNLPKPILDKLRESPVFADYL